MHLTGNRDRKCPLGVEAATEAGIFTIAVNTGLPDKALTDSGAAVVYKSMHDLLESRAIKLTRQVSV